MSGFALWFACLFLLLIEVACLIVGVPWVLRFIYCYDMWVLMGVFDWSVLFNALLLRFIAFAFVGLVLGFLGVCLD